MSAEYYAVSSGNASYRVDGDSTISCLFDQVSDGLFPDVVYLRRDRKLVDVKFTIPLNGLQVKDVFRKYYEDEINKISKAKFKYRGKKYICASVTRLHYGSFVFRLTELVAISMGADK